MRDFVLRVVLRVRGAASPPLFFSTLAASIFTVAAICAGERRFFFATAFLLGAGDFFATVAAFFFTVRRAFFREAMRYNIRQYMSYEIQGGCLRLDMEILTARF